MTLFYAWLLHALLYSLHDFIACMTLLHAWLYYMHDFIVHPHPSWLMSKWAKWVGGRNILVCDRQNLRIFLLSLLLSNAICLILPFLGTALMSNSMCVIRWSNAIGHNSSFCVHLSPKIVLKNLIHNFYIYGYGSKTFIYFWSQVLYIFRKRLTCSVCLSAWGYSWHDAL